jgi:hypothetical protein
MTHETFQLTLGELHRLVEAGGMAPSGGNIQPWHVTATDDTLGVRFNLPRATSFLDVGRLASALAAGAFVENVTIAAESLGLRFTLVLGETTDDDAPLAQLRFTGRRDPAGVWPHPLYPFIPQRTTNRQLHEGPPIDAHTIDAIAAAAGGGEGRCRCVALGTGEARREVARLLGATDVLRMFHREMHEQMFAELRWSPEESRATRDGIDVATLELPPEAIAQLGTLRSHELVVRAVPPEAIAGLAQRAIMGSSHMACLTLSGTGRTPTRYALLEAGRTLARLWLTATQLGVALQPWSVLPFLVLRVRHFGAAGLSAAEASEIERLGCELEQLFDLGDGEVPVFVFRLAYAPAASARALRLPWTQYTTTERRM